ncbi:MAG: TetR/AcrR family transcriptional regulator [Ruminococcaceae bacterium]|nr:TetR/AcrR family transcriptional regulator [Oscillospiraceae bacterium]
MDRRQRKTREAIFKAFTELLSKKSFNNITVGEIIAKADVGRATFYAHFETKDYLLKEMCRELFCHIFDSEKGLNTHRHIFECEAPDSVFLHLFMHFQKNDNHILDLLISDNNELFLSYFKAELKALIESRNELFTSKKSLSLPHTFFVNHIASSFVETLKWWADNGLMQSPEKIYEYFSTVI